MDGLAKFIYNNKRINKQHDDNIFATLDAP